MSGPYTTRFGRDDDGECVVVNGPSGLVHSQNFIKANGGIFALCEDLNTAHAHGVAQGAAAAKGLVEAAGAVSDVIECGTCMVNADNPHRCGACAGCRFSDALTAAQSALAGQPVELGDDKCKTTASVVAGHEAGIAESADAVAELVGALADVEWSGSNEEPRCPQCWNKQAEGHKSLCVLGKLIFKHRRTGGDGEKQ